MNADQLRLHRDAMSALTSRVSRQVEAGDDLTLLWEELDRLHQLCDIAYAALDPRIRYD